MDWEPQTIQVESIVGRDSYLDKVPGVSHNSTWWIEPKLSLGIVDFGKSTYRSPKTEGWETQPLRRTMDLCTVLDYLVVMKCQQNLVKPIGFS